MIFLLCFSCFSPSFEIIYGSLDFLHCMSVQKESQFIFSLSWYQYSINLLSFEGFKINDFSLFRFGLWSFSHIIGCKFYIQWQSPRVPGIHFFWQWLITRFPVESKKRNEAKRIFGWRKRKKRAETFFFEGETSLRQSRLVCEVIDGR